MAMSSILQLATRRRTTRIFKSTPVNLQDILYGFSAAVQAPSGANRQPWHFLMIDDLAIKQRIRTACENAEERFHMNAKTELKQWFISKQITSRKPFLTDAPVLLAVFSNQEMPYATESTWLAIGYLILALEEKSLSTLTYTPSYPEEVKTALNAPKSYRLETILPIGYSGDPKLKEERRPVNSSIHHNLWNPREPGKSLAEPQRQVDTNSLFA